MQPREIFEKLVSQFSGEKIEFVEGAKQAVSKAEVGDAAIIIPAGKLIPICEMLNKIEQFSFDCLSSLTAVDRKENFEVVYHLFSYKHRHGVTLKVILPKDAARLETIEGIWGAANWLEREVFDLFGIKFDNHSDLRRIMLPDDWVGHPLRKDYKEEASVHGIATTRTPLIQ